MKNMKLMVAAVFAIATSCFAMEQENLIVENQTGTTLGLKWAKIGLGEVEESRDLPKNEKLNLGSDVAYLKFSIGGAYHIWRLDKLNALKRQRGIVAIQLQDLTSMADIEKQVQIAPATGAEIEYLGKQAASGMNLLDWFPRVKAELVAKYGQEYLAGKSIAEIEQLIDQGKQDGSILARDFFELNEGYTEADVRNAVEQLNARINQLRAKIEATMAARLMIDEAKAQAYRDLNK